MKKLLSGASLLTLLAAAGAVHAADAATADTAATVSEVIVTGTRQTGVKAVDSAAPIEIVGGEALKHVGQPDLIQTLAQNLPSFNAEALGGDTANLTLTAALRGLNPNNTLVLVNGKRRHGTGNLHVLGSAYQGAASADIGLIPAAAIDHVEVLEDGAAAQYGTDAIAGVVNFILKHNNHGGTISATGGQYFEGDGDTGAVSINLGLPVGSKGFFDLTLENRYHGFSRQGGADRRVANYDGTLKAGVPASFATVPNFPNVNNIVGDAQSNLYNVFYNAGYDFGVVQFYTFGSFSHRKASAYENYRVPSKVIASPVLGVAGSFTTPGELIFRPHGFNPREGLIENDYAITGGFKGVIAGWDWDLSTTYGRDKDDISTLNSANRALFIDTHTTPTNFYDGAFTATQWTNTLDLSKEFAVGLASPLTVALGAEARKDTYGISQGDPASIYKEGGQSYPGFQPSDAGSHSRTNYAGYVDLAVNPVAGLKVDLAGRVESYSDFGETEVGKITVRYDFNPMIALRGTFATGFRAPTLAEEFYSATNVSPTAAVVQLPANSPAAALLGLGTLKPEKSDNYSVGFVVHPFPRFSATVDFYEIDIRNKIVATGTLFGFGGAVNSPAVLAAIAAHGNIIDPTVTYAGVSLFTNGQNTRTQGIEATASYSSDFGDYGHVDWTVAANYTDTKITATVGNPVQIAGQQLFDKTARSYTENSTPKEKISLGAFYSLGKFSANLRETIYGPASEFVSPNGGAYYEEKISVTAITDLEFTYELVGGVKVSAGANNLFDHKPPRRLLNAGKTGMLDGSNVFDAPVGFSPFGIHGGYYYGRVTYSF